MLHRCLEAPPETERVWGGLCILGNGGLKNTATYEEDDNLHRQVKLLQKIDIEMKQRERNKVIVVTGTELLGELSFTIDDE